MLKLKSGSPRILVIILLGIGLLLTGCGEGGTIQVPGFTAPTETPTPSVTPTQTPTFTPTPTETPRPPVGILLAPEEADQSIVQNLTRKLSEWIPAEGLRFQVRPSLSEADFELDRIQWVIAIPPVENLSTLVSANPQTTFLVVGDASLDPAPNLNLIGSGGVPVDHQGFMAGYIGTMVTEDWRVGMIGITNHPQTLIIRDAFVSGALFFCPAPVGYCSPLIAPYYEYPLYVEVPENAEAADRQAVAQYMFNLTVDTFYIMPGAGDANLYRFLAENGKRIIGTTPPPADVESAWIASLMFSPIEAFDNFWPQFVAGATGQVVDVPLSIEYVNSDLFSPGRLQLAEEMLQKVQAGVVEFVPQTGSE